MAESRSVSPIRKQPRGPELVGHFLVGSVIGKGTFGQVKLGIDTITGEKVAIKTLEKSRFRAISAELRIARELQFLREVRHPHIIQLYETYETKTEICLIMEYASRGDLLNHLISQGKLKESEACRLYQQLMSALDYLHSKGVAHRDVKPENILLDCKCNVKLADFGLSNNFESEELMNTACGSPCYACPEAIAGKPYVGPKADVWSSGVVLFTLISGALPFEDSNLSALYQKILAGKFSIPEYFSTELRELIENVLQVDPKSRFSVQKVLSSPWLGSHPGAPLSLPSTMDEDILAQLERLGVARELVIAAVEGNKHNQAATAYYLLLMKKVLGDERNASVLGRADLELTLNYRRYLARKSDLTPVKGIKLPSKDTSPKPTNSHTPKSPLSHYSPLRIQSSPKVPTCPHIKVDLDPLKLSPRRPSLDKGAPSSYRFRQYSRDKSPSLVPQSLHRIPPDAHTNRVRASRELERVITALRCKRSLLRRETRKSSPKP